MKILVTGGAGYVGSTCTAVLCESGHDVTVLDNLSTGNREAVHPDATFIEGNVKDKALEVLAQGFDGVIHFAARSLVGESVEKPDEYWQDNMVTTLALLDAMRAGGCTNLVFSSSAATYGEPAQVPITEDMPTKPTNPYGMTKLSIDFAITSYAHAFGLGATSLRYFNVAGAYGTQFGENRAIETHIIPLVLQVALGQRDKIFIFGDDWPTKDGTCVRDYIHIRDLADAHLLALETNKPGTHRIYNLGSGDGYSVKEVIDMCRHVTGHPIPAEIAPRRAGDPAVLIASSEKIKKELGWNPTRTDLKTIVTDAWTYASTKGDDLHSAHR